MSTGDFLIHSNLNRALLSGSAVKARTLALHTRNVCAKLPRSALININEDEQVPSHLYPNSFCGLQRQHQSGGCRLLLELLASD
ncbi:hypothetical protein [Deefgea sp. CFH1-16]|uniref:hypothetical protein n=1 Tax=Deefgea sp. CFH1-16 TaxID=2675457 RepID=UPI0015F572FD|nr:hypothetical protein [Deefgea sp. CFH1-16]MBM5574011.1 hypothetical protein [Deefgea sp. CFH1-16]